MDTTQRDEEFVRLYARNEGRLRRYVSAMVPVAADVDDILQDTAVALMRKFDEYDSSLPFFNWACRFALYEVMQYRKKNRTHKRHFSEELISEIAREYLEFERTENRRKKALSRCLEKLPQQDRRLVELRYGSDETIDHVASRVDQPVSRLYRSLARIREQLADCVRHSLAAEGIS